jgi:hypothetical protein
VMQAKRGAPPGPASHPAGERPLQAGPEQPETLSLCETDWHTSAVPRSGVREVAAAHPGPQGRGGRACAVRPGAGCGQDSPCGERQPRSLRGPARP